MIRIRRRGGGEEETTWHVSEEKQQNDKDYNDDGKRQRQRIINRRSFQQCLSMLLATIVVPAMFVGLVFYLVISWRCWCCGYYYQTARKVSSSILLSSSLQELATKRVIVSIGTVPCRQAALLQTLQSIMVHQTVLPGRIYVHYSDSNNNNKKEDYPVEKLWNQMQAFAASSSSPLQQQQQHRQLPQVRFFRSPSHWKTAQKILGTLYHEWGNSTHPPPRQQWQQPSTTNDNDEESLIVLADDDFVYSSRWLESLLVGHLALPQAAVALRGWRVRRDLEYGAPPIVAGNTAVGISVDGVWGSFPAVERYAIQGDRLCCPYPVGVVVGCNGILLRPSFFDADMFQAPSELHFLLNDLWNSGHLAQRHIPRYVVPMLGSDPVGTHLGQHATVIDAQLRQRQQGAQLQQRTTITTTSRWEGNTLLLHEFREAWEQESHLYWSPVSPLTAAAPPWKGWLPLRHWISENVILKLHSISWIRRAFGGSWKMVNQ